MTSTFGNLNFGQMAERNKIVQRESLISDLTKIYDYLEHNKIIEVLKDEDPYEFSLSFKFDDYKYLTVESYIFYFDLNHKNMMNISYLNSANFRSYLKEIVDKLLIQSIIE